MKPVCLISGGSDGLGFALAKQYLAKGYDTVVTARRAEPLALAVETLQAAGTEGAVTGFPCDMTDLDQLATLSHKFRERFSRLDVLINAVGKSDRGLATKITSSHLDHLWRANVLSAVATTQTFLNDLTQSKGSIVNIGSLASKFAPRWLGAYPMVKHALGAWSQQLRLELLPQGIHVLLVCPGPIKRFGGAEEQGGRYAEQSDGLPPAAALPAGGAKVKGIDPVWLSEQIFLAQQKRHRELIIPRYARILAIVQAISPRWGDYLLLRKTGN